LQGDLDNIVCMGHAQGSEGGVTARRKQMAGDIQRYLEGKPVIARRDTMSYRFHQIRAPSLACPCQPVSRYSG